MRQDSDGVAGKALPAGELDWLAPARLLCSQRAGGVSQGVYASNNLGLHVDDSVDDVLKNRAQLLELEGINSIQWLNQVHGVKVVAVSSNENARLPTADAMYTTERGVGLAILTADCLPVVLVDSAGELVAAAHAGWRGLCAGVLQELVHSLPVPPERLRAFIGPAIGRSAFEVGPEVVAALSAYGLDVAQLAQSSTDKSRSSGEKKYQVDLALAGILDLRRLGVAHIDVGGWCTATDERFYSWRRETRRAAAGETPATGRQATLIWLPAAP